MTESRTRLLLMICFVLTLGVAINAMLLQSGKHGRIAAAAISGDRAWPAVPGSTRAALGGEADVAEPSRLSLTRLDNRLIAAASASDAQVVRAIQRELAQLGYAPGPVDGLPGLVTRSAIMAFEHDSKLPLTGEPSEVQLRTIVLGLSNDSASQLEAEGAAAGEITATIEASLQRLGYGDQASGRVTARSITRFERDSGLKSTGRISGQLATALLRRLALEGPLADAGQTLR